MQAASAANNAAPIVIPKGRRAAAQAGSPAAWLGAASALHASFSAVAGV